MDSKGMDKSIVCGVFGPPCSHRADKKFYTGTFYPEITLADVAERSF